MDSHYKYPDSLMDISRFSGESSESHSADFSTDFKDAQISSFVPKDFYYTDTYITIQHPYVLPQ